jgi:hypothetical protein
LNSPTINGSWLLVAWCNSTTNAGIPWVTLALVQITTIMEEYFTSGDVQNAATSLEEIDAPQFMYWAVKKLVTLAMDKRPHEREMASVLLSALYGEVVSSDQMQTGFIKLLEAVGGSSLQCVSALL